MISWISYSVILSPMFTMAYVNSSTEIFPSLSASKTRSALTTSASVSESFPLSLIKFSRLAWSNYPELFGSTFFYISTISASLGFKLMALTRVPNSCVCTKPSLFLSKSMKISLISLGWISGCSPGCYCYPTVTIVLLAKFYENRFR